MELPNLDLTHLVIGGVSLAPIIFLIVEGLKRIGVLTTRERILAAVVTLATAGYALSLVAQANPALAPVFARALELGQALLSILVPAGSAVLLHRAARAASGPQQASLTQTARRSNGQRPHPEKRP